MPCLCYLIGVVWERTLEFKKLFHTTGQGSMCLLAVVLTRKASKGQQTQRPLERPDRRGTRNPKFEDCLEIPLIWPLRHAGTITLRGPWVKAGRPYILHMAKQCEATMMLNPECAF